MTKEAKIQTINRVLEAYFEIKQAQVAILAKDLMPQFIEAGIFPADQREGLPLRNLLRSLDKNGQLQLIPYVIAERRAANTSWYFGPYGVVLQVPDKQEPLKQDAKPTASVNIKSRSHSDESYVLDLCDEILEHGSTRQHRFPFLKGDPSANGTCALLPVDAWYEPLNLVVEYNERQHTEAVKHFDKRMTVSGVTRGEQRKIYDSRKLTVLAQNGIQVLVLSYADFRYNSAKRIARQKERDIEIIRMKFKLYSDVTT